MAPQIPNNNPNNTSNLLWFFSNLQFHLICNLWRQYTQFTGGNTKALRNSDFSEGCEASKLTVLRTEPRYSDSQVQRPTEEIHRDHFIISIVIKNNFHGRMATAYFRGQDQAEAI